MRTKLSAAGLIRRGVVYVVGLVALLLVGLTEAANLYVSPNGVDSTSCGPQGAPCRNPDYAVNKAISGDTVFLAASTYRFANVQNQCSAVPIKSVVCLVDKAVTIRGGYSSTWTFDPASNPTIIDGQSQFRGAFVYSSRNPGVRLTMANVTIQNARAKGIDGVDPTAFGGGINVDNAAVTLDSVTFLNNQTVGADTTSGQGGSAVGSALSIRSTRGSDVSYLSNVRFQGNTSTAGRGPTFGGVAFGAVFIFAANVGIENSSFVSNSATAGNTSASGILNGQRADALGGAIAAEGGSVVSLARITATGNQVQGGSGTQYGGGAFGGAVFIEGSTVTIEDSLFQSNVAKGGAGSTNGGYAAGGGVLIFDSNGTVYRTRIIANRATGGDSSLTQPAGNAGGGGLNLWHDNPAVTVAPIRVANTVIADNIAELGQGLNPGGGGGGLWVQGLSATLVHLTLARNQLGPGLVVGQAMVVVQSGAGPGNATLKFSVVANHVAATPGATAVVVAQGSVLTFKRGAFSGNTSDTNINNVPLLPGVLSGLTTMSTISSPGFVSPGSPQYDYHISSGSLLRGAATGSTSTVDMDFQLRADGAPDLGADEYVASSCVPGAGDSDSDGIPDAVEQKEGTRPCAKDNDVFGSVRLFIMQQYRDFLGREADVDGLLAWTGRMGTGTDAEDVVQSLFNAPEFWGSYSPVTRVYFAFLNRIPDAQGLAFWTGQFKAGMGLIPISEAFSNSPEFLGIYGALNNSQFVTRAFQNAIGRSPTSSELSSYTGQLDSGAWTRGTVMLTLSKTTEFKQRSNNEVFVTLMYYGMLRRVPSQEEFNPVVAQLDAGGTAASLITTLLNSTEYEMRFLP